MKSLKNIIFLWLFVAVCLLPINLSALEHPTEQKSRFEKMQECVAEIAIPAAIIVAIIILGLINYEQSPEKGSVALDQLVPNVPQQRYWTRNTKKPIHIVYFDGTFKNPRQAPAQD